MEIYRLPAFRDNYIFLLYDAQCGQAAVVDPGDADPVLQQLDRLGATLTAILNTHHHSDHVGGNRRLLEQFPALEVYAGADDRGRIPGQTQFLQAGDGVVVGDRTAQVLAVPGHTRAHIAYYFAPVAPQTVAPQTVALDPSAPETVSPQTHAPGTPDGWGDLFCGDTLFAGGCGRLFEGTPQQMVASLTQLRQLPDTTRVWCAHEYTLNNLRFAIAVDGDNADLQRRLAEVETARDRHQPTVPSDLGTEKRTNPFLRWDAPVLQRAMGSTSAVQTFARLRGKKDLF